jgi:hypothetical protein
LLVSVSALESPEARDRANSGGPRLGVYRDGRLGRIFACFLAFRGVEFYGILVFPVLLRSGER